MRSAPSRRPLDTLSPADPTRSDATQEDLNLLGTLGPVLAKRYGPIVALADVLLLVLIKIIRRRRR